MTLRMCPVCQGTKKVKGLGMMDSECPVCEGIGKVDPTKIQKHAVSAAVPLTREALPDDYYTQQQKAKTAHIQDANFAYKNRPSANNDKDTQNTPAGNIPSQNIPLSNTELTSTKLAQIQAQIKPRNDDDTIGMPQVELSASQKAELKALEQAVESESDAQDYVEPVGQTVDAQLNVTAKKPQKTAKQG